MSQPCVIRVGLAVIIANQACLVGVRGPDGPLAGFDEFPGGKCEPNESPVDCVRREAREETGLTIVPIEELAIISHAYPHATVELHAWRCALLESTIHSPLPLGWRWIPLTELTACRFPTANAPILERTLAACHSS